MPVGREAEFGERRVKGNNFQGLESADSNLNDVTCSRFARA